MSYTDYRVALEEIVHKTLYECSLLSSEDNRTLENISKHLNNSSSFVDELRNIIVGRNNDNYFTYNKYVSMFLNDAPLEIKLNMLNNFDDFEDILNTNQLCIDLWKSLDCEDKVKYLNDKKRFNDIDYLLINNSLKECGGFKTNLVLNEIINNDKLRDKIESNALELSYSYKTLTNINLSDFNICRVLTKESYTKLLLKKCKSFSDFKNHISGDDKLYSLIERNSLIFDNEDNEDIYNFILANHNYIGKFDIKYLNLFSIMEITTISKDTSLDEDAYSTILQKLYSFNKEKANELFVKENILKCSKHSISVNPFYDLNEKNKKEILDNYTVFSKFVDTIMVEIINDYYTEDDILNSLRDDDFVKDMTPYALELLLNKLSFKSSFNMIQRQIIFNKITNLNVKVVEKDRLFFKGYLDSPSLLYKSEHNMIYEMLNMLSKEDVSYYIGLPYINNCISNYEIVNLINKNELDIIEIIDNTELYNKLNTTDLINIIDKTFEKNPNLNIFKDRKISKTLFNLSDETLDNINFDEVNYLYENIKMKSLLSSRESKTTILSYKAVMACYLSFGLETALRIVNNGNMSITLNDVKLLQNEVVNERLLLFKENNSQIFSNISKRIIKNLNKIGYVESVNDLAIQTRKNTFLDDLIYLILDNDYDSYNRIIEKFYSYIQGVKYDEYKAKQNIYDYAKEFTNVYLCNKAKEYNEEFENVILNNFIPKDSVLYSKRKEVGRDYLDKLKFKLFVKTLTSVNKEQYIMYFKDSYIVNNLEDDYKNYLAKTEVDFKNLLNHVLIPIMNERFDKDNCLSKLGINKPEDTNVYLKYLEDLKNVELLNKKINNYKAKYSPQEILPIMENICFNSELNINLTKNKQAELKHLNRIVRSLNGELEINRELLTFEFKDNMDLYNINKIIEYVKYLDILDEIILRTKKFINKCMDDNKIRNYYSHDYFKTVDNYNFKFPITNRYYELKKHVLSLQDMEKIFDGYDLTNPTVINGSLFDFLINKKILIMLVDGYYDNVVDNLGVIISKWNQIIDYADKLKINDLSLIGANNLLNIIDNENNIIINSLSRDIIKDIYKDRYYEINDISKRLMILTDLYKNSFKRITSSIPYVSYKNENYRIEIIDNYNQDSFRSIKNSLYCVGAIGNDLLHYSILNPNGIQIGIYDNDILVDKVIGIRNGNTLYLNSLEGEKNIEHHALLKLFANEIINLTKDSDEQINFVTIVNNDVYASRNSTIIDSTICSCINYPIDVTTHDYEEFSKNGNLLNYDELYTSFEDSISTLLASNKIIDKESFKYYLPTASYRRIRNKVIKLSNNIGEEFYKRIETILELYRIEFNENMEMPHLSNMDTIYLGDDFVVFVNDKKEITSYVLPYDNRAKEEVDYINNMLKKN